MRSALAMTDYTNPLCAFHHMGIRHDVAVMVHNDSGANAVLMHDERRILMISFDGCPEPGYSDLNHGRRNLTGQLLKRVIELRQHFSWNSCCDFASFADLRRFRSRLLARTTRQQCCRANSDR